MPCRIRVALGVHFTNQNVAAGLEAAIETGDERMAFELRSVIETPLACNPRANRIELLHAMAECAKRSEHKPILERSERNFAANFRARIRPHTPWWRTVYAESGYVPKGAGPVEEIGKLLVDAGDLRGARFVAEDYAYSSSASEVTKRYALYCSIIESAIASHGWSDIHLNEF